VFVVRDQPALVLAPMDGVTDATMRALLARTMPFSHCVTEFLRVSSHPLALRSILRSMPELAHGSRTTCGTHVQLQLLGGDPELLARTAEDAAAGGALGIDLNFGCPAPTVNRHDGGATLLRFPERIERIVRAVRSAVPAGIPVSAKLRLGWDDPSAIFRNAEMAERGGASWITIHGRTKFQGYTPPAYWGPIGVVRRSLGIPVVANGEIWSVDDLRRCEEETGCRHFMLGRGALARLSLAAECATHLGLPATGEQQRWASGASSWLEAMALVASESRTAAEGDRRTLSRMKQWLNYAHKRGSISWFDSVKRAQSTHDLLRAASAAAGAAPFGRLAA